MDRKYALYYTKCITKKYRKEPCYICGKFKEIVEDHHIFPISEYYERMAHHFEAPYIIRQTVFLCPNHHKIVHLLYKWDLDLYWNMLNEFEYSRMKDLVNYKKYNEQFIFKYDWEYYKNGTNKLFQWENTKNANTEN